MATTGKYGEEILDGFARLQEIFLMNCMAVPTFHEDWKAAKAFNDQVMVHFDKDDSVKPIRLDYDVHLDLDPGGASPVQDGAQLIGYRIDYGQLHMVRGDSIDGTGNSSSINVVVIYRLYPNDGSATYDGSIWYMDNGEPGPYQKELIGIGEEPTEVEWPVVMKQLRASYNQVRKAFGVQSTDAPNEKVQRDTLHNLGLGRFLPSEDAIQHTFTSKSMRSEDISTFQEERQDDFYDNTENAGDIVDEVVADVLAGINFDEVID